MAEPDTSPTEVSTEPDGESLVPPPSIASTSVLVAEPESGDAASAPPDPPPPPVHEATVEVVGRKVDEAAPRWSYARSSIPTPAHFLTVPSLGPVGKRRHPLTVLLLTVVTLGAYLMVWHSRVNHEVADFDARVDVRPGRSTMAMLLPWLAGVAASVAGAVFVGLRLAHQPTALTGVEIVALCAGITLIGDLIVLFPPALVATVMTVERVRRAQERVGMGVDLQVRPVRRLAILALPGVGLVAYILGVQRCLNRVWKTVEPPAPPPVA